MMRQDGEGWTVSVQEWEIPGLAVTSLREATKGVLEQHDHIIFQITMSEEEGREMLGSLITIVSELAK